MSVSHFLKEVGRPVAYYPKLARMLGSVNAAVFLCQLIYLSDKGRDGDGWIYKTQTEIEEETGLTRRKQESVRAALAEKGILQEMRRGTHGTLHFRVDFETLDRLWSQWLKPPMAESANDHRAKAPNANGGKRQTLNKDSETTAETTTQTESVQGRAGALLDDYFETVGRDPTKVHGDIQRSWLDLIAHRLRQGWSDEQIRQVWLGCTLDNWPDRQKFNAVADLLASPKRIDHFINLATLPERTNGHAKSSRTSLETRPGKRSLSEQARRTAEYFTGGVGKPQGGTG
jgi:hypothetical protein